MRVNGARGVPSYRVPQNNCQLRTRVERKKEVFFYQTHAIKFKILKYVDNIVTIFCKCTYIYIGIYIEVMIKGSEKI